MLAFNRTDSGDNDIFTHSLWDDEDEPSAGGGDDRHRFDTERGRLSELFTDIAMSYDEDGGDDDDDDGVAGKQAESFESCARTGADAPPPSPEYSTTFCYDAGSNDMIESGSKGYNLSTLLTSRFSELSNSSDMDTLEH